MAQAPQRIKIINADQALDSIKKQVEEIVSTICL